MEPWLTIINVIITVISFVGAFLSLRYYRKTKFIQLVIAYNNSIELCENILQSLNELYKYTDANHIVKNARNCVRETAVWIKGCTNQIKQKVDSRTFIEIDEILNRGISYNEYFGKLISGALCPAEYLINDSSQIETIEKNINELLAKLKEKGEKAESRLK